MQNENSNSRNWKQKLESIDSFPADMQLNKEAAWGKLEAKLQHRPKRRKALWYWAAACLLPLLLLSVVRQKRSSVAKNISHTETTTKPLIKELIPVQKESVIVKAIKPAIQNKKQTGKTEMAKQIPSINPVQTLTVSNDSAGQNTTAITATQTDTNTLKTVASAQVIKKLKVFHNNELSEPAEATPEMAHAISVHPFPFQIARGEVHGNDVKTIHSTSFISFKTKPLTN